MRRVTQEEFFKVVGPRDVHPRVIVSTLRGRYHESQWEDQRTRALVGMSRSDSHGVIGAEYFLAR